MAEVESAVRERKEASNGSLTRNETKVVESKQEMEFIGGLSMLVGTIIGSGIFMSPSAILANVSSVGASLFIWIGCGILATMSALSYVELGMMAKKSGGEYPYMRTAYGDVVAYLLAWTSVFIIKPSILAIMSISFAEYMTTPFYGGCSAPDFLQKLFAALCILLIVLLNCFSVKISKAIQVYFRAAKIFIIALIILGGFVKLGLGYTESFKNVFAGRGQSFSRIALGFYSGLWSYDGWNQLNFITEEVKNPSKDFPRTIMVGIPLVTVCYILVNIAYFTVMNPDEIVASSAVAITFGDRVFGPVSFIVPVAVACSMFGAANGFAITRFTNTAGRRHMMKLFPNINVSSSNPSPALMFNALIALIMIIPDSSSFTTLIDYFSFALWIFYGFAFLSVIVLRFRKPDWERPYKVFIIIPAICFLISIYLIIAPLLENPSLAYLFATIFILTGLIFYFPLVHFKYVPPSMEPLARFFQELLEIVPPPDAKDSKSNE